MGARDLRYVMAFTGLAFALAWLVALPLWFGDGLASPWFPVVAVGMMTTPAVAALVVVSFLERPQQRARALGLWPLTPVRRLLGYAALAISVPIALVLAALPVGALLGVFPADFVNFSGFRATLDQRVGAAGAEELPLPVGAIVAIQLATLPLGAFVNLVPALGEELGWRGWLLPKLLPLGTVPALLVSGVVWRLWHAPLVLLGYNYPDAPGWLGLTPRGYGRPGRRGLRPPAPPCRPPRDWASAPPPRPRSAASPAPGPPSSPAAGSASTHSPPAMSRPRAGTSSVPPSRRTVGLPRPSPPH